MLKSLLTAFACSSLLVACVTADEADLEAVEQVESSIEAQPICSDLYNEVVERPESCTTADGMGIKWCTQTCDLDRQIAFTADGGWTCKIVDADCTPWRCGPCEVVGPVGPLP